MDVDTKIKVEEEEEEDTKPGSLLSNPGKLESIIKFGRSLQELAQQVNPKKIFQIVEIAHLVLSSHSLQEILRLKIFDSEIFGKSPTLQGRMF